MPKQSFVMTGSDPNSSWLNGCVALYTKEFHKDRPWSIGFITLDCGLLAQIVPNGFLPAFLSILNACVY